MTTKQTQTPNDTEEELAEHINDRNWKEVEERWLALSEQDPERPEVYQQAIEDLVEEGESGRAVEFADLISSTWLDHQRHEELYNLLLPLVEEDSLPPRLKDEFIEALEEAWDDHPALRACLDLSDIKKNVSSRTLEEFRQYAAFQPGQYVYHSSGWGPGKITDVMGMSRKIMIDFHQKPSHEMNLSSADRFLDLISEDDPRALYLQGEEKLKNQLDENPQQVIFSYLKARDTSIPLKELREMLQDYVFSSREWSNWWNRTKKTLMEHPNIQISGKTSSTLKYREEVYSMVEEAIDELGRTPNARQFLKELRRYKKYLTNQDKEKHEKLNAFIKKRLEFFRKKQGSEVVTKEFINLLYYLRRETTFLEDQSYEEFLEPILDKLTSSDEGIGKLARILNHLSSKNDAKAFLSHIHQYLEDQPIDLREFYQEFMSHLYGKNWEIVARQLLENDYDRCVAEAIYQISGLPGRHPQAYIGLVRARVKGILDPIEEISPSNVEMFRHLIDLASGKSERYLPDSWSVNKLGSRIEKVMKKHPEQLIEKPTDILKPEEQKKLSKTIRRMTNVKDSTRAKLLSNLEREEKDQEETETYFWEGKVIYSTKENIERKNEEYQELISEKIPENRQAIKEARAQGDLSENAEYEAALEERDLLLSKARTLEKKLEQARELEQAPIQEDRVQPGTSVQVQNLTEDKRETYKILGPWDGDTSQNIISYETPLAKGMLGAEEGETLEISIPSGTKEMKIEKIEQII